MRTSALRLLAALSALCIFTAACSDDEAVDEEPTTTTTKAMTRNTTTTITRVTRMTTTPVATEDHEDHDHGSPVDFEGADIPTLGVRVEPDPAGGINITVDTTNFVVAPEAASTTTSRVRGTSTSTSTARRSSASTTRRFTSPA